MFSDMSVSVAQNVLDGVYVKEHYPTRKVIPYTHLREADVMWATRIWRKLDLREKINHPLYYPTEPIKNRRSLTQVIIEAVREGSLTAYDPLDDEFTMTLTKAELADMLFEQVGLNKREAKDMVESFFEEIRSALERGECVKLSGFGNFQLRDKPQRPGRNPKTGEEIPITARRVVTFHASQKLKAAVESLSDAGKS